MTPYQSILAFFTAAGQIANMATLILQHNYTKDDELKKAKDELYKYWQDAYSSRDKSRIVYLLDVLRQAKA